MNSVPAHTLTDMGQPRRRQLLALAGATLLTSLTGTRALAQADWPNRPIRFIVPFSAGGAADTAARAMGAKVGDILGQSIIIENRTGGNAVVAANAVLGMPKDGYTFIWDAANQLTNPLLLKDLTFDYAKAFAPVTMGVRVAQALVVRNDFPARTVEEFIAYAKARPGTVSCGTPPAGAMGHLAMALLQQRAGIKLIHAPYRGGADAGRDLMGGQIDSALITTSTARGAVAAGKARILALTSAQRNPAYQDVPTLAERGFPRYDMDDWFALFAASGTPVSIINRMQQAVAQAARDPALTAILAPLGAVAVANTPQEFGVWLTQQREVLDKVIREANITLS
ncbi:Bug family tripartite tricarboxylate transporter substrate binding protein [Polaromonas eurypsychrophila]|nr:tripartite tricarboxylate transporter substrate binding protein [Polaromonas eurypsychrophila]